MRSKQILQFRLGLLEIRPMVWRCIQVPAHYTLPRLHRTIQLVMGWQDYHLHEFTIAGRIYGDPAIDEAYGLLDERRIRLRDLCLSPGDYLEYLYDPDDNWQHVLNFKTAASAAIGTVYPRCIDVPVVHRQRMSEAYQAMRNFWQRFTIQIIRKPSKHEGGQLAAQSRRVHSR